VPITENDPRLVIIQMQLATALPPWGKAYVSVQPGGMLSVTIRKRKVPGADKAELVAIVDDIMNGAGLKPQDG